jgi:hypothetical protein
LDLGNLFAGLIEGGNVITARKIKRIDTNGRKLYGQYRQIRLLDWITDYVAD